jgi:hypothetical protein
VRAWLFFADLEEKPFFAVKAGNVSVLAATASSVSLISRRGAVKIVGAGYKCYNPFFLA